MSLFHSQGQLFQDSSSGFGGRKQYRKRNLFLSLLVFCIIMFAFYYGFSAVSSKTSYKEADTLKTAVNRSIIDCYAVEGFYPENLDYIKEHYHITYDTERFFVDYQTRGQNIMPDVTIIRLKKD